MTQSAASQQFIAENPEFAAAQQALLPVGLLDPEDITAAHQHFGDGEVRERYEIHDPGTDPRWLSREHEMKCTHYSPFRHIIADLRY
jgi:hypothetical protein